MRLELIWYFYPQVLNLLCLPFHHQGVLVPRKGVEPLWPYDPQCLRLLCIPVPSSRLIFIGTRGETRTHTILLSTGSKPAMSTIPSLGLGTWGGSRTLTISLSTGFKPAASTIPPPRHIDSDYVIGGRSEIWTHGAFLGHYRLAIGYLKPLSHSSIWQLYKESNFTQRGWNPFFSQR